MNIAYLDPPYSQYFHQLGARLVQRTGGSMVALLSSPAYRLYTGSDRTLVCPSGRVADPAPLPAGVAHAVWSQTVDRDFLAVFWHAVAWFRDRFSAEGTQLCLVFSDARPFSLAAALAAAELGVRVLYFERGAYRFRTASLSLQGLNARFSLDRARLQPDIVGASDDAAQVRRPLEPGLRWRFAVFIVANGIACTLARWRRKLQHKHYAFGPYVRLALVQWWGERRQTLLPDRHGAPDSATPVLVLPLQLPTDAQMRLASPFDGNQALLDFVVAQALHVAPEILILVKRHPMDSASYRLPPGAHAVGGNLNRFYRYAPVFVCVNSTVGFEAAAAGRPVLCFGASFYTDTAPVRQVTPENFASQLAAALQDRSTQPAGRQLHHDVLRWYQAPGDAWAFTEQDLVDTVEIVLQHHAAAAPQVDASSAPAQPQPAAGQPLQDVVGEQRAA
jgi:capsular polysaccharide export protein